MKTESKIHWIYLLLFIFITTFGFWLIIYMLNSDSNKAKSLPIGAWVLVGSLSSIGIGIGISMIIFMKKITIDEQCIRIKYLYGKELSYLNKNIQGCMETVGYNRTGEYQTFYFKTNDNKVYTFSSNEYRNYAAISAMISSKCSVLEINKFHNLKKVLLTLLVSMITIAGLILIKLLGNAS